MLALVTGGSASGKSEYAENLLCKLCHGNKLYIAAMQPCRPNDAEFAARVERHRALRAGKGFKTEERYTGLAELETGLCSGALLECLSNLCANELFSAESAGQGARWQRAYNAVLYGVERLCEQVETVVVVTNEVFSDGCVYDDETLSYLRLLGALNVALATQADCVVEVVCGIPLIQKNKGGLAL